MDTLYDLHIFLKTQSQLFPVFLSPLEMTLSIDVSMILKEASQLTILLPLSAMLLGR